MRKYQQLALVIIAVVSIIVLLSYKSENNDLKYVLKVVNLFGRHDAAIVIKLANSSKLHDVSSYSYPLPVWQRVGSESYAYSSYWNQSSLVMGGESITIGVSSSDSLAHFRCSINFENGRSLPGKFSMQLFDNSDIKKDNDDTKYTMHILHCKTNKDAGKPKSIKFIDATDKTSHEVILRPMQPEKNKITYETAMCVNMIQLDNEFATDNHILQFLMYHHTIGIDDFLIYNGDYIKEYLRLSALKLGINLHYLPFNFPFEIDARTSKLIELDCLSRTLGRAKYSFILNLNEFIYPNGNLQMHAGLLNELKTYENVNKFVVTTLPVCIKQKNKLLMDNLLYRTDLSPKQRNIVFFKTNIQSNRDQKNMTLSMTEIQAHSYLTCDEANDNLKDWISLMAPNSKRYLETIRNQMLYLF